MRLGVRISTKIDVHYLDRIEYLLCITYLASKKLAYAKHQPPLSIFCLVGTPQYMTATLGLIA